MKRFPVAGSAQQLSVDGDLRQASTRDLREGFNGWSFTPALWAAGRTIDISVGLPPEGVDREMPGNPEKNGRVSRVDPVHRAAIIDGDPIIIGTGSPIRVATPSRETRIVTCA